MAVQLDSNGKDDLKTQFATREGTYRVMSSAEYSRPNRVGYSNNQGSSQVKVSLVSLPQEPPGNDSLNGGDRICFNFGKELYVYPYKGVKKASDLHKPVDKKLYKGTSPSCHDFNTAVAAPEGAPLLVGFSTGQIQLVQPGRREPGRLYNEERLIDKTKVTCLRWVPGSPSLFLAAHASGYLYLYNEELACSPSAPHYQMFKSGEGYTIHTCKTKSTRNPIYRWTIGTEPCCVNEFCFSPCGTNLAVVSQDGFLRVFHYDTMELIGIARSYFGGFLCVCWSPDGKYIVVGGEDDLVTIWSVQEQRVVARGQGHRSWVSVVAFDPYTTSYSQWDGPDFSDDEAQNENSNHYQDATGPEGCNSNRRNSGSSGRNSRTNSLNNDTKQATCYRLGSVSQDTQLCLWDITEDVLRQPVGIRNRLSSNEMTHTGNGDMNCDGDSKKVIPGPSNKDSLNAVGNSHISKQTTNTSLKTFEVSSNSKSSSNVVNNKNSKNMNNVLNITVGNFSLPLSNDVSKSNSTQKTENSGNSSGTSMTMNSLTQRLTNFSFGDRKSNTDNNSGVHKRNFSLSSKIIQNNVGSNSSEPHRYYNVLGNNSASALSSTRYNKSSLGPNDPMRLIGTAACPRFDECPVLEPLICKKISHERLTALIFREDCFLTACQDGYVYTWARPGYTSMPAQMHPSPTTTQGGTVV
uniref:Putative wd40 protein dmr-n9 n=1 Tax=Xenopsylla cheopis TaxID=163159 RepID=A0A6M2DDB7_XENCH